MEQVSKKPADLRGQVVEDAEGEQIGMVLGVYLGNETKEPEWVAVRLPSTMITLVPVSEAAAGARGLQVPVARAQVLDAPYRKSQLASAISEDEMASLYCHYVADGARTRPSPAVGARTKMQADRPASAAAGLAAEGTEEVAATVAASGQQVATEAARQATEVAASVKGQAQAVVETAVREASQVAEEVSGQASELLESTTDQVVNQAQAQLDQLAETMHRWAGEGLALARGNPDMAGPVAGAVGRAGVELQSVSRRIQARGSMGLLADAQEAVGQHPTAAIAATAVVFLGGGKLLASPAGDRVKAMLAPLKQQSIEAGRSVAEELKPIVERRVGNVRTTATQATERLKQEAESSVQRVAGQAKASTATVKGTARASTAAAKGTAAKSASTVKRSARPTSGGAIPARTR